MNNSLDEVPIGTSFKNDGELKGIVNILNRGGESKLENTVIVTFYLSQLKNIQVHLYTLGIRVHVTTVDSVQGSEYDFVVLSTVRTRGFGFIEDSKK
jgi:superfamily I DNA and/or RNA helicase